MGSTIAWAAFLRPFAMLIVAVCLVWPVEALVRRYMKPGKLKDALLKKRGQ